MNSQSRSSVVAGCMPRWLRESVNSPIFCLPLSNRLLILPCAFSVFVCVFFHCLCLCPVLNIRLPYSMSQHWPFYNHKLESLPLNYFHVKEWLPLILKYVMIRSLLSPHSNLLQLITLVQYLLRSFQSSVVLSLVSFTLINCLT